MSARARALAIFVAGALVAAGCSKNSGSASGGATDAALATAAPLSTLSPGSDAASAVPVALATPASPAVADSTVPVSLGSGAPASADAAASSAPAPAASVAFDDIAGDEHALAIENLGRLGVLDSTSGDFRPHAPIKRREFVRWLFKTNDAVFAGMPSKIVHPADHDDPSDFTDVTSSDPDFIYIQGLSSAGVSVGFPDKTFRPDENITREQSVAIKTLLDAGGNKFAKNTDVAYLRSRLPAWKDRDAVSKTFVPALSQDVDYEGEGHVDNIGRTFGTIAVFRPRKALTRGQAAEMLQVMGGHTVLMILDDVPKSVTQALNPSPAP